MKKRLQAFLARHWAPLASVALSTAVFWRWLNAVPISYADWPYKYAADTQSLLKPVTWLVVNGRFGGENDLLWRWPFQAALALGSFVTGTGGGLVDKLFVFWPVAFLLPLAGFVLTRHVTRSDVGGFVGSLVIAYNTYVMAIDTQGHEYIPLAMVFLAFGLWAELRASEDGSVRLAAAAGLLLAVCGYADFRIAYIGVAAYALAVPFALMQGEKAGRWRRALLPPAVSGGLFILLNAFWVLPQAVHGTLTDNAVLGRGLFGDQYWNLSAALTAFHPFWAGANTRWFAWHPVPLWMWAIPVLAFAGLALRRRQPWIAYFGLLAMLGVFLAKQSGVPFGGAYQWLFAHVPGFNAFREATKFYVLVAIGYAALIGAFAAWAWALPSPWPRRAGRVSVGLVSLLFLVNVWPVASGSLGMAYQPVPVPPEFAALQAALARDHAPSRYLIVPTSVRWLPIDPLHPKVNGNEGLLPIIQTVPDWKALTLVEAVRDRRFAPLLQESGIRYVVVPSDAEPTSKWTFGSRQVWIAALDASPGLKRVDLGTAPMDVYETVDDPLPRAFASRTLVIPGEPGEGVPTWLDGWQADGGEVRVHASATEPFFFLLTDASDTGWNLYPAHASLTDLLFDRRLPSSVVSRDPDQRLGNAFRIDPKAFAQAYPGAVVRQADGMVELSFRVAYRPQAFLQVGLWVSLVGLVGGILCLIIRKRGPAARV